MAPRDEAVIDRMDRLSSPYLDLENRASLSVNDVAAVFSQSNSKYIKINLHYAANRAQGMLMATFGFLISGLVCGRSLCGSVDGVHGFSLKDQRKNRALELTFDHEPDASFFAITSALTEADRLEKFSIGRWIKQNGPVGPAPIRDVCWGWLAIALWGRSSKCTAREVKIHGMDLTELGVAAFKAALKINFPEPESDSSRSPQYGYINLQAGTQLHTLGLGRIDQTKFELLHDCRCRALISHTSMHGEASVIVPGHGICGVKLRNDRIDFARDIQVASDNPISTVSTGIGSLKLVFSESESGVLMMKLLPLIGASLRSLSIDMIPPSHAEVDLSLLAASCPHLTSLSGAGINLSVSDHSKALGEWGLKQLVLKHPNNQATIETCLSCLTNTTQRMSRELVELTIWLSEVQAAAFQIAMDALKECSGTFLPLVKEKSPHQSKVAVISAVKMRNGRKRSVGGAKAIHRLDENVMGLIFEYSATPEQRSVRIIRTK